MSNHSWLAFWSFVVAPCLRVVAPCLRVVTPFLPVIKPTSSIPLLVVFLWNDGISHGCAMFFQLRHVFADAPCFYWCAITFCVFGLRQKFWEQDSLGMSNQSSWDSFGIRYDVFSYSTGCLYWSLYLFFAIQPPRHFQTLTCIGGSDLWHIQSMYLRAGSL